ncbi:MAG TPA: hypothetical protein EYP85_09655 [Armatimonadetes bacterium]|nr:hypothetical protein [Armatimonadota bacterium]
MGALESTLQAYELLDKILDSLIKLDLLVFFYQNPDTIDSASGIATWVGHEEEQVVKELAELAAARLIERHQVRGETVYTRSNDPDIRRMVDDFMELMSERENRLRVVAQILAREEGG